MGRANFYWDSRNLRWVFKGHNGAILGYIQEGTFSFSSVDVNVADTGSIAKLNSPIATITNMNVGTLATIRTAAIGGVASLADARIQRVLVGGGATISLVSLVTGGTLDAIAAVGTGLVTVATVSGIASAGIAVGDLIFLQPLAALGGNIGIAGCFIPTTNVVNAYLANTKQSSAGSYPGGAVTIFQVRG